MKEAARVPVVGGWLRALSPVVASLVVFLVMSAVYLPTAAGDHHQSVDSLMASFAAWSVAERGTLDLADIAIVAAVLFGLATATWSISGTALWTHGPSQLWLAVGMLAVAGGRYATSGLGWSLALLTRPHLAVVAAAVGLSESRAKRSWRPAAKVAATTAIGLGAWLLYGRVVFGEWTLLGGYVERQPLEERLTGAGVPRTLVNLFWMTVHPVRGFLPYSPFLLGLAPGMPRAWRRAPSWVRASAIAGVAYLVAQAYINRWSGGSYYWGYRYAIESLTLVAPLLVLAHEQSSIRGRRITMVLVAAAIALQVPGAVFDVVV